MKKLLLIAASTAIFFSQTFGQTDSWKPAGQKIMSEWAQKVNPNAPLPEYPRPQMTRDQWQNLNGLWNYTITAGKLGSLPTQYEGKILVPYAIESALSGVGKTVGKDSTLWYHNQITLDKNFRNKRVLLHFGAVDFETQVFINGQLAGSHEGGYDPFSIDITAFVKKSGKQDIVVGVWDPTNQGYQANGKQVVNPHGIWYTPVTGIWQTIWVEAVPPTYIRNLKNTPQLDAKQLEVEVAIASAQEGDELNVLLRDGTQLVSEKRVKTGQKVVLNIGNVKTWSPDRPFLYDLEVQLLRKGKVIDQVGSYAGMRKISMLPDQNGVQRMLLNNEVVFQYGPLDQGWWPDGLYTAPTDEALKFDILKTKEMGFNMIRKHIKVEPARWYYHCDQLGMLVWQDMPSGDLGGNHWDMRLGLISGRNQEKQRTAESEALFRKEWKNIMDALHIFPSIVMWVPFNEAWGQFKTVDITEWTMKYDPSRLVNSASGGNFFPVGHINDIHNYPDPVMPMPSVYGTTQVLALGEFGGLGLPVEGHTWQEKDNWGYQSFKNTEELKKRYEGMINDLKRLIPLGLSAAIYTQTTDVEIETNGLMTYDRKIIKIPEADLHKMHAELYKIKVQMK
jgi:beta-galactosidase/beta-glucuronidase